VTFTEFEVAPDATFWHAFAAGVDVDVGSPELHAARPATRSAALVVAVRALREVRTVVHPALSASAEADSGEWVR
jgi:hypothetical protein